MTVDRKMYTIPCYIVNRACSDSIKLATLLSECQTAWISLFGPHQDPGRFHMEYGVSGWLRDHQKVMKNDLRCMYRDPVGYYKRKNIE